MITITLTEEELSDLEKTMIEVDVMLMLYPNTKRAEVLFRQERVHLLLTKTRLAMIKSRYYERAEGA